MADISKIKLPNGSEYDLKDTVARATGKVSGVKGSAENAYRTGDVNLTPANLGLGTAALLDSTVSVESNSTQLPTSGAVSDRITNHIIISETQPITQISGDMWFVLQQYTVDSEYTQIANDYGGNTAYINSEIESEGQ